jgi:hypothetical protein
MRDYGAIPNSLSGPNAAFTPGTISLAIEWRGVTRRRQIGDPKLRFTARVIENKATMQWTATVAGVTFASDPADASHSIFAEIGHERNGVFF